MEKILQGYVRDQLSVGTVGSHSALDICQGATKQGLRSIVVAQKGREKTYAEYYKKKDDGQGIVDEVIVLEKFADTLDHSVQEKLRSSSAIFVPHRSFVVYLNFDYDAIESKFSVPVFGNRFLLRLEERQAQYDFLKKANIPAPKIFSSPDEIDRTVLIKVSEKERPWERAFFLASSKEEYWHAADALIAAGNITLEKLERAPIEEFIVGTPVNFHYFYSPLRKRLELIGVDTRRQTNLDGFLRLPADFQSAALKNQTLQYEEAGHIAVTVLESMLEDVFRIGEQFVEASRTVNPRGIWGPFTLQGAITAGPPKKGIVIFDISPRIGGAPGIKMTPYSEYLFGRPVSLGERVAIEIKEAAGSGRLGEIVS